MNVHILAMARFSRYQLSHQKKDLDKSILYFTEAIFLSPMSRAGPFPNSVQTIFRLAVALLGRSEEFKQPEDIKYSIEYLRHLRLFPLDSFDVPRISLTTSLIRALRTQVRLGVKNGTQNIKEMVVLCNELLSLSKCAVVPTAAFSHLREAANIEFNRGLPIEMLGEVIECLRDAGKVDSPGSYDAWHEVMYALAYTLGIRFFKTHSKEDYGEATAVLERILKPGGCPDSYRVVPSSLAIALAHGRSAFFREPEYSQIAIFRLREEFSPSLDEGLRLLFASSLTTQTSIRFREYDLNESLEEANSYISQLVNASSSLAESAELLSRSEVVRKTYSAADIQQNIERLEKMLSITPSWDESYIECLSQLETCYKSKFRHTGDISDIEEAIKYSRLSLDATHASDQRRIDRCRSLSDILLLAFQETRNISYLDESITVGYDILESKTASQAHLKFPLTQMLVSSILTREQLLGRIEDSHEAIRLISSVIDDEYAREPDRFRLSCRWAILARSIGHPTTSTAYKTAMSLMQKSFSFAPTVSIQHSRLIAMGKNCQTMPLDYASYQIHLGQFEEAVETLEQGRALLWSEMRGLRTSVFQLIEEDSPLAKRFADINQELETLTISVTPSGRPEIEDGAHQSKDGTDPFGLLVTRRMKLVEERDALISQIQSRPGLEGFLGAPPFDNLRSAASHGPVIIINHCELGSSIMIVFHNSLPCTIPTTETFFTRANDLRDELVEARKHGLESVKYQDALCSVLKGLYELVGEPVIKKLRLLGVPEQSRIWWCPTSVFCSLPLHAMGPIPSGKTRGRYFLDLYIPSYTPSLSALIESRRATLQMPKRPSFLLVAAQHDDWLPGVSEEIKVIQRALRERVTLTCLISGAAVSSSVIDGLRGSRFAHFASHGVLEVGKPFDASFKLHRDSPLTLLDIIQSRIPNAEFAFLSCCRATETTEESAVDEALHLTAAMQYCGFRSVVGTMWEMADVDGKDLAKRFYKSLFSSPETSVPYYERSAGALRYATQRLREKRGITLERWVNFVHYGA